MTDQQKLTAIFYAFGTLGVNRLLTFDTIDNPVSRFCFDHDGELKAVKELHGGQWKILGEAEE